MEKSNLSYPYSYHQYNTVVLAHNDMRSYTDKWIDYHEEYGYFSKGYSRHSEREEVLFWMRGISPQFKIEHITTPEEWKQVSNQLNPKLILNIGIKLIKILQ